MSLCRISQIENSDCYKTHIVMCKDQLLLQISWASILAIQPFSIPINSITEDRPLNSTDQAPFLPLFHSRFRGTCFARNNLMVNPVDHFLASLHPLIPISPDKGSCISLRFQKIDTVMKFAHPLRNLLRRFWNSQVTCSKGTGVEIFLESPIDKGPEEAGANFLPG